MKGNNFFWFVAIILSTLIQTYLVDFISIDNVRPEILLILLIYYCLNYGQFNAIILGFITGLGYDFISVGVIGSTSFSYIIAMFFCGYFYNENKKEFILDDYYFLFIVFVISFVQSVIFSLLTIKSDVIGLSTIVFRFGLFPAIYTSVLSSLLYLKSPKKYFTYGK